MRRRKLGIALAVTLVILSVGADSGAARRGLGLLPDLRSRVPRDLSIQRTPDGRTLLLLTNEVVNVGRGPLEIHPVNDDCDGNVASEDRTGYQWIYQDVNRDGVFQRGVDDEARVARIGCMHFHEAHDHWHLDDFADYRVFPYEPDGTLSREPFGSSGKVSFCVLDDRHRRPGIRGSPSWGYYSPIDGLGFDCLPDTVTGISVGWAETYQWWLPDQHVDVTGIAPGDYCVVQVADPHNLIRELDETNNSSRRRMTVNADLTVTWRPYRPCDDSIPPPAPHGVGSDRTESS